MSKLRILIVGRSREAVEVVREMTADLAGFSVDVRVMNNGHTDPLEGVTRRPDVLVLQHSPGSEELRNLAERPSTERLPLIVYGPADDADAVRMAMRAGARDYLPWPVPSAELQKILQDLADELSDSKRHATGSIQVFMNGKGGAGASFLATNVAHGLATADQSVTLIDLDLQFAGLCRYLDLEPTRGLFEALDAVEDLDEVSAQAFTCEHDSGLRLLSAKCDRLRLNVDVSPERLAALLQAYRRFNDFVIVDVPRNIDLLNAAALEAADNIAVVLQQSLPHLHDTARLLEVLRSEIGVDDSRLSVVVNRYVKDAVISTKDIEKALRVPSVITIPNQYKLVAESIDSGIPLAETARNAAVARGLRSLQQQIGGVAEEEAGLLGRALPGFLRR